MRFFAFSILFSTSLTFAQSAQIPLEDFFKNPVSSAYQISPDGQTLAYLKPWKGRMNVFVRAVGAPESSEKRISSVEDRDLSQFFWKGSENIFYLKDFGGDENFHLFRINIKTGEEKDLTPFEQTVVGVIDSLENVDDQKMLISHNQRDKKVMDVYRLDLRTNKATLIFKNPGQIDNYLTDQKGRLLVATQIVGTETQILYRENEQSAFKTVLTHDYNHSFEPLMFTDRPHVIYAFSNLGRNTEALVEYDLKAKRELKIIFNRPDYDLNLWGRTLIYSHKQKKLLGLNYLSWKVEQILFDPEFEKIFADVRRQLPVANIMLNSMDKAEQQLIFSVGSDRLRGQFYHYNKATQKLNLLADTAPWLKADQLAQMQPIQFRSRDGLTIHGYLVLPTDYKEDKKVPFVVNPHGGPWARDIWRFNSEAQFLANRGFGVLQINFRGSTGYGKEFLTASYKQWGLKMQDDVTDGTHWLVKQGYADAKRICIYGGSYGGYATLMGLVKEPNLYACGVNYVGVSNLFTFMSTIPPYWEPWREKMYAMVGHPEKDKEQFTKTSPALNVDKIKAPLFIAQGAKDPRVNKNESDQVVANLKARGIDVPYLLKENEGHGFRNEENRFEFYREMEKFLKKHTK